MKLNNIIPMLATGDLDETIAFYRDVLGFDLRDKFESGGRVWWCEMVRDGNAIMFTQHESRVDAPGAREGFTQTSINFYVDGGIEEMHMSLKEQGHTVSDLRVTFYGIMEFDLKDPTGYTLVFGEPTDEPPTVVDPSEAPF